MVAVTREEFQEVKKCLICKEILPRKEFALIKGQYLNSYCNPCNSKRRVLWGKQNIERAKLNNRKSEYKNNFNITVEEYDVMFIQQKGCCAICGKHHTSFKRKLAVDHNHVTGQVRALLCGPCNTGLGKYEKFKDKYDLYLKEKDECYQK